MPYTAYVIKLGASPAAAAASYSARPNDTGSSNSMVMYDGALNRKASLRSNRAVADTFAPAALPPAPPAISRMVLLMISSCPDRSSRILNVATSMPHALHDRRCWNTSSSNSPKSPSSIDCVNGSHDAWAMPTLSESALRQAWMSDDMFVLSLMHLPAVQPRCRARPSRVAGLRAR